MSLTNQKVIAKLNEQERIYFSQLFQYIDVNNTGLINGKDSVAFFRKTSLPIDILKKIWINASSTGNTLDKDEFFVALKLFLK